jgi:hypothetical protein
VEQWGFIWLMFALKIPIVALLLIVWWAIRADPGTEQDGGDQGDGGIGDRHHPRTPRPTPPRRRGPHGDPLVPSPLRVRRPARPTTRRSAR